MMVIDPPPSNKREQEAFDEASRRMRDAQAESDQSAAIVRRITSSPIPSGRPDNAVHVLDPNDAGDALLIAARKLIANPDNLETTDFHVKEEPEAIIYSMHVYIHGEGPVGGAAVREIIISLLTQRYSAIFQAALRQAGVKTPVQVAVSISFQLR